jgi:hypothetical protein
MADKEALFKTKCCPKNAKSGKPRPLKEWTLQAYIDVAHELGWIRQSARDIGVVLRDYRNFIHPEKERTQGISLSNDDSDLFWSIFNTLAHQILRS